MVVLKKVQSLKVLSFGKSYLHVEFLVLFCGHCGTSLLNKQSLQVGLHQIVVFQHQFNEADTTLNFMTSL